ncbi:DUF2171 domain-containing protein [Bradyrhizobium sp. CER78]|uniref:DUF2171 domain-containing protein n=1 Tax=Bradyrhizobium sp. CER78 TaxID=3039162 RepID=UPI002449EFFB|nr:DUF2171 domain-containing protein [Bradyrhizobium sp. CER78]MDH2384118.1 DUF2171 domain-containing protein [Bradyrhizobium sp. CER78]
MKEHQIKEGMAVVGFDGVQIGVVDGIEGDRIKLKKSESSGHHKRHHHYIGMDFVDSVVDQRVRLCSDANIVELFEEEKSGRPIK